MSHIHPIYAFFYWDCTSVQNFRAIGPLFMEILHFKDLGDTSVVSECSLGVSLIIDNLFYEASDTLPLLWISMYHQCKSIIQLYYIYCVWNVQSHHMLLRWQCTLKISIKQNKQNSITFESNRTISYGDIAFWRFGGYECRLAANAVALVIGGYKISIAKYLRGVYTHIKFESDRLNIFRVRVFRRLGLRVDAGVGAMLRP